jgi:hypothetical protein
MPALQKQVKKYASAKDRRHAYYLRHRDQIIAKVRAYAEAHSDGVRLRSHNRHYKMKYGLNLRQVAELKAAQGGLCAMCRLAPARVVDHDHRTGKVRGILCYSCNRSLAILDDPFLMEQAERYIRGSAK